jgi:uncharacterized protein (TIGR04222 family)
LVILAVLVASTGSLAQGEDNGTVEDGGALGALAGVDSCAVSLVLIVVAILVTYYMVLMRRRDGSENLPMPDARSFHPYDLAMLRSGIEGLIETATVKLVSEGELRVGRKPGTIGQYNDCYSFRALNRKPPVDNIESAIMAHTRNWLPATKYVSTLSRDRLVRGDAAYITEKLQRESLYKSPAHFHRARKLAVLALLLVMPFFVLKAFSDIMYDGTGDICLPVLVVPIAMWWYIVAKDEPLTALGMRFRDRNANIHVTMGKGAIGGSSINDDPVYRVAVNGIHSVGGDPRFVDAVAAFTPRPKPQSSSSGGGGCCGG